MRRIIFLVTFFIAFLIKPCFSPLLHDNGATVKVTVSNKQYRAGILEYVPETAARFGKYIVAVQDSTNKLLYVLDDHKQPIRNTRQLDQAFLKTAYERIQFITKQKEADIYYTSQAPPAVSAKLPLLHQITATCAEKQLHFRPWLFFDVMGVTEEYFTVITDNGAHLNRFPIPEMPHFNTLGADFPGRAALVPRSTFKKYTSTQLRTLVSDKNAAALPGAFRVYASKGSSADIRFIINDAKNNDACFHIFCDASQSLCVKESADNAQEIQWATMGATIVRKYYMHAVAQGNVLIQSNVPVTSGYADLTASEAGDPGFDYCLTYSLVAPAASTKIYNGMATSNQEVHLIMAASLMDALYAAYFLDKKTVWLDISQSTVADLITLLGNADLKKLIIQSGLDVVINVSSFAASDQKKLANAIKTANKGIALRAQTMAPTRQKKDTLSDHVIIMQQESQSISTVIRAPVQHALIDSSTQQKKLSIPAPEPFTPTKLPDGSQIIISTTAVPITLGILEYTVAGSPVYLGAGSTPDGLYIVPSYKGDASAISFPLTKGYLIATDQNSKQALEELEGAAAGDNAQLLAEWVEELLTPALADTIDPTGNLKRTVFLNKEV